MTVTAPGTAPTDAVFDAPTVADVFGITAARRAGLFTVAVPGPMSAHHDFDGADLVVSSLTDVTLARLGEGVARRTRS